MNVENATEVIESLFTNVMVRSTASAMRPSSMIRADNDLIGSELERSAAVNRCLRAVPGAAKTRAILNLKGDSVLTIALVSGYQYSRAASEVGVMKLWIRDWANEKRPEDHVEGMPPEVIEKASSYLEDLISKSPISGMGAGSTVALAVLGWTIGASLYAYDQDVDGLRVEDFFTDESKENTGE